jgi:hypothetical protein
MPFGGTPDVGVNFRVHGLDQVQRGLKIVKDEAAPTGRQWGTASRQIAGGLEQVARTGKITGESLKSVISNAAEMAFMFGAGGPIVAALGITGVAIYERLTRNFEEASEKARAFRRELAEVARGGSGTDAKEFVSRLRSGDPFAAIEGKRKDESDMDFLMRSRGIAGLSARQSSLTASERFTASQDPQKDNTVGMRLISIRKQLAEVTERLATEEARLADAMRLTGASIAAQAALDQTTGQGSSTERDAALRAMGLGPSLMRNANPLARTVVFGGAHGTGAGGLGSDLSGKGRPEGSPMATAMVDGMKAIGEIAGRGFVDTFASTIEAGITKAFEKGATLGGVFAAIGQAALGGIGSMISQIGRATLASFAIIENIKQAFMTLNPVVGVAASLGLIALGAVLQGAGGRMSANAGGGGGGNYSGGYAASAGYGASIIDRGIIDPTNGKGVNGRSGNQYNFTVIGTNDPRVKREIIELIDGAERRGRV